MAKLTMPTDAQDAVDQLESVGKLLTAKKWERSAIVAALVGPAPGSGRKPQKSNNSYFSVDELAEKGITGLTARPTIIRYRDVWFGQRDEVPEFGTDIDLPDVADWPAVDKRQGGDTNVGGYRATQAETAGRAKSDPEFVQTVMDNAAPEQRAEQASKLMADPNVVDQVVSDPKSRKSWNKASERKEEVDPEFQAEMEHTRQVREQNAAKNAASDHMKETGDRKDTVDRHMMEALRLVQEMDRGAQAGEWSHSDAREAIREVRKLCDQLLVDAEFEQMTEGLK